MSSLTSGVQALFVKADNLPHQRTSHLLIERDFLKIPDRFVRLANICQSTQLKGESVMKQMVLVLQHMEEMCQTLQIALKKKKSGFINLLTGLKCKDV